MLLKARLTPRLTNRRISGPITGQNRFIPVLIPPNISQFKMDDKKERKARKPNFSVAECNLLLQLAEENLETIREKFSNNLTNKKKESNLGVYQ